MPKNKKLTILIIEDNPQLNIQLARSFQKLYCVDKVTTLQGAFNYLAENTMPYDLILLDQCLPDGNGFDLIPFVQKDTPTTKICILTNTNQETARATALQLGADAYLTKPLSSQCLLLHAQALLRRGSLLTNKNLIFADLCFDTSNRVAVRKDTEVQLSQREGEFLRTFIRSIDGLVSKEDLQRVYWKNGYHKITRSAIHVTIQRLRKKLLPLQVGIESIYGLGYRLTL